MALKERYQNPSVGDDVNLRLFTYNNNTLSNVKKIERIEIFHLDPDNITDDNPYGKRLVEIIDPSNVVIEDTGTYRITINLEESKYVIGKYCDIWTVVFSDQQPASQVEQFFQVYPSLWYTMPTPVVYDFSFHFQPNKFRKGSKQYIIIEIVPNVPTAGDLRQYYENLAIVSDLKVSIQQRCGDCLPAEADLRMVVEDDHVDYREKRFGFYKLDTEDLDCGIYDIWFKLEFGENVYVSDRMQFQIYD